MHVMQDMQYEPVHYIYRALLSPELQCIVIVNSLRQMRTVSKVNNKFLGLQLKIDLFAASIALETESAVIFVTEIILVLVFI